jgi:formylglycine-generating enzyme required for sulfatase activity
MKRQTWIVSLLLAGGVLAAAGESPVAPGPGPGMVPVPAGAYIPLFRAAGEPKETMVEAFLLDAHPVTNGEYVEFVRAHPKWRRSQVKRLFADAQYLAAWAGDLDPGPSLLSNAPVTQVSWFAARAFATWKGKRLPTLAEWEYAAAATGTRTNGADPELDRLIRNWYSRPSPSVLPSVGSGSRNMHGVHDLHGLVWEWVEDFSTSMVTGDARGDTGLDRQLFCGVGADGARERSDYPAFMRYGFRTSLRASYTVHNLGFRCARSLTRKEP